MPPPPRRTLDSPHLKFPTRATSDEYSSCQRFLAREGESELKSRPHHFDSPRGSSIGFVARHPTWEGINSGLH